MSRSTTSSAGPLSAAAEPREIHVLETYEGAPAVADSLFIIVRSYERLGMQDLAGDERVESWKLNYPDAASSPPVHQETLFLFLNALRRRYPALFISSHVLMY